MPITVPYDILQEGYRIQGGRAEGLKATVPYLVRWADAFTFYNQALGYTRAATPQAAISVQFGLPFPPSTNIFASRGTIEPCGAGGETGPMMGLGAGECFTHAKVTIEFDPPSYELVQLDPQNPITYCEIEIDTGGQVETLKAEGYEFDDGKPVTGDLGRVAAESRLVLTFPEVPYLPWQLVRKYIGTLNLDPMLDCETGTLLFEAMKTKFAPSSEGLQGKQVQITLAYQELDWNMVPRSNGVPALVRRKGDHARRIFNYTTLTDLFIKADT